MGVFVISALYIKIRPTVWDLQKLDLYVGYLAVYSWVAQCKVCYSKKYGHPPVTDVI